MFSGQAKARRRSIPQFCFIELERYFPKFGRFAEVTASDKQLISALPQRRKVYAAADAPFLAKAATLNCDLPRLVGSIVGSKTVNVSFHELVRMEALAKQALEAQSVAFCMLNALLGWVKQVGFTLLDPNLFEELIHGFSLLMVNGTPSMASLASFAR